MNKAKITIQTHSDGHINSEKYICNTTDGIIVYTDKQKTQTTIEYNDDFAVVKRVGYVNYTFKHDGQSKAESLFETHVEGQPFSMDLKIENKYYKLSKYGKILSIEIHFLREDNDLIKQIFKVEER